MIHTITGRPTAELGAVALVLAVLGIAVAMGTGGKTLAEDYCCPAKLWQDAWKALSRLPGAKPSNRGIA